LSHFRQQRPRGSLAGGQAAFGQQRYFVADDVEGGEGPDATARFECEDAHGVSAKKPGDRWNTAAAVALKTMRAAQSDYIAAQGATKMRAVRALDVSLTLCFNTLKLADWHDLGQIVPWRVGASWAPVPPSMGCDDR
jgi:hypothetical protein